jgi:geranylgeranyl pyrophosphate synthase
MIAASVRLGGLIAAANARTTSALGTYGRKIGLAFQIVDDLLDVSGTEEAMGKRVGKDDGRGKLTFPAITRPRSPQKDGSQIITLQMGSFK